jgi:hypothetical protein
MLKIDHKKRITAKKALEHPFFSNAKTHKYINFF